MKSEKRKMKNRKTLKLSQAQLSILFGFSFFIFFK